MSNGEGKFTRFNPVMVLVVGFICCIYYLYWMYATAQNINKALGEERLNPVFAFIPCLNILLMWNFCNALDDVRARANMPKKEDAVVKFILLWFLAAIGAYLVENEMAEVWDALEKA